MLASGPSTFSVLTRKSKLMRNLRTILVTLALLFAVGTATATLGACGDDGHDHQHDVGDGDGDGD